MSPADPSTSLAALADPTRRAIFELLGGAPSSVRALTDRLPISQPAVSQHLRVLREAGLVVRTAKGASNVYRADPSGLRALRDWIDSMWGDVLDAFVDAARREARKKR